MELTLEELQGIAVRALQASHSKKWRTECAGGQVVRAWERLADEADSLHAILTRQELYDSMPEPGLVSASVPNEPAQPDTERRGAQR